MLCSGNSSRPRRTKKRWGRGSPVSALPVPGKTGKQREQNKNCRATLFESGGSVAKMLTPITVMWVQGLSFTMQQQKSADWAGSLPSPSPFSSFPVPVPAPVPLPLLFLPSLQVEKSKKCVVKFAVKPLRIAKCHFQDSGTETPWWVPWEPTANRGGPLCFHSLFWKVHCSTPLLWME